MLRKTETAECYLVVGRYKRGAYSYPEMRVDRMSKKEPSLKANERAVKVRLTLPISAFETPQFTIDAEVESGAVLHPSVTAQMEGLTNQEVELFHVALLSEKDRRAALECKTDLPEQD